MFKENDDATAVKKADVEERMPGVLKLFEKKRKDDPSGNEKFKRIFRVHFDRHVPVLNETKTTIVRGFA